ncbi:MAG: toxin-activating lysine-acyltransferase [Alphaproteobacteria bacterium]|nr:toxin-activating lysine-acyltransferase [Alphaproteobacteria bacterium]
MGGRGEVKGKPARSRDAARAASSPNARTIESVVADKVPLPKAQPRPQPNGPAEVLGDVVWLMTHSPTHKHLFIADMEWLVLPPLMLRQCSLLRQGGRPFAFISWATVSEEVEARISMGQLRMGPQDWRSGEQAWIIDMIAPFGGGEQALKEIRERVFAGRKVKALQPAPDGVGVGVVEW